MGYIFNGDPAKVTRFTLTFKDFDEMDFFSSESAAFLMEDIAEMIAKDGTGVIRKMTTANSVRILLSEIADNDHFPHGTAESGEHMTKFERLLKRRDITSITLHYEDERDETLYVPYIDTGTGENSFETVNAAYDGGLAIAILKN